MMIKRWLSADIEKRMFGGKAIIIMGARQTGKTTLLRETVGREENLLWLNADEPDIISLFEEATSTRLKSLFSGKRIVVVDEAQRIHDVGLKLKLITDSMPEIQLIATGSSSFELANSVNEPLTGRKWEYKLYPLSFGEMADHHGLLEETRLMPHRLVYGYYPDVVSHSGDEKEVLKQLSDSYLYKDILMWERIKKPEKLVKLLQALALQLGSEISYNNLANLVSMDKETVEKYIQILEKTYVIFRLPAFSRNHRKELKRGRKIYFIDNGIRNAILADFNLPELRNDLGALWENFVISERMKYLHYQNAWVHTYFWRTQDQQEIDYIEEGDGKLRAFEIKWNSRKRPFLSKSFSKTYPDHTFTFIHPENFTDFIYGRL
jgi:predicted AAA+ superfamily ATPase